MSQIPTTRGNVQASDWCVETSTPMIGGLSRESGDTIIANIDAELSKLFEDRNITLTDGGTISYATGSPSVLTLTTTLKLIINSQVAGGTPTVITLTGTSFNFSANGKMLYAVIDRIGGTASITADASTLPSVISSNQEIFLIAKRYDGATQRVYFRTGQSLGNGESTILGSAAVTPSFNDANFQVFNNSDSTKIIKLDASGITPATTRTYTVPDASGTLVLINNVQNIDNKAFLNTNSYVSKDGSSLIIQATGDVTKQAKFDVSNIPTGTTRTYGVPSTSTTFVGTDATQTLTNKTIDSSLNTISNIVNANISGSAAIAYSKLTLTGSIVNADVSNSAAIDGGKITAAAVEQTGTVNTVSGQTFSGSKNFQETSANASLGLIRITSTPGSAGIQTESGGSLAFYTGGTGSTPITTKTGSYDSTGTWAFGASSGTGTHSFINDATSATVLQARSSATSSADGVYCLVCDKGSTTNTTSQNFVLFRINATGTQSGKITANGANAAAFGSTSDARLKENITDLPSQLDNVLALRPVEFDFRDGSGHQIGFIAQEMQTVYPDVVSADAEGILSIAGWSKTESRLVKAIQELSARLDAANVEIEALKNK